MQKNQRPEIIESFTPMKTLLLAIAGGALFIGAACLFLFSPSIAPLPSRASLDPLLSGNAISDLIIPFCALLMGVIFVGASIHQIFFRKPSLIINAQGIQCGRKAKLVLWQDIISLIYGKYQYTQFLKLGILQVVSRERTHKSYSLAQSQISEPIPEILSQIQEQFSKKIKENHITITSTNK